jgi:hypothetical protein
VQIYSQNLFLNYYIVILFYFISLALTKLAVYKRVGISKEYRSNFENNL